MWLFAKFILHLQLLVTEPAEHVLSTLPLAHFDAEVQGRVVVDVAREVVGLVGEQHLDDVLAVLLAGLVQRRLAGLVAALEVGLAAEQHGGHLVLAHLAGQVQRRHLVGPERVHVRDQVALQAAVDQLAHLGHVVELHLPDQLVVPLLLHVVPLPPVLRLPVRHVTCCFCAHLCCFRVINL